MLRSNFSALLLFAAIGLAFPLAWASGEMLPRISRLTAVLAAGALTVSVVGSAMLVLGAIA